jgi:hypothetical protein
VLPAVVWRVCDCEICGESFCGRTDWAVLVVVVDVEMVVPVWRRTRIAVRMGRVSRLEGEMSGGRMVELGAWEAFVILEVEKEAGGV